VFRASRRAALSWALQVEGREGATRCDFRLHSHSAEFTPLHVCLPIATPNNGRDGPVSVRLAMQTCNPRRAPLASQRERSSGKWVRPHSAQHRAVEDALGDLDALHELLWPRPVPRLNNWALQWFKSEYPELMEKVMERKLTLRSQIRARGELGPLQEVIAHRASRRSQRR